MTYNNRRVGTSIGMWLLAGALIVCALLTLAPRALAADPIQPQMELSPTTLTAPGTVRVSINVFNNSDDGVPISVTLYDPNNNVCSSFGSGGTANLSPGQSMAYQGNWTVTQAQLDAGKVIYSVKYTMVGDSGQPVSTTRPISRNITYNQASANLKVDRSFDPSRSVAEGQTVTIKYKLTNAGNLDITDISISDPEIQSEPVTHPLLKVGEEVTLSQMFTAGTESKTSAAVVTYSYLEGTKTVTKDGKMDAAAIDVSVPDVSVVLTADKQVVEVGGKVTLHCVITNKSGIAYEKVKVTDPILNDVESSLSLPANKSVEITREVTVDKTRTHVFTVEAIDSAGSPVTFVSNEVLVYDATDPNAGPMEGVPLDLDIEIESDRTVIYAKPTEVIFRVRVTNFSDADVSNVVVAAAGRTIKTISEIKTGETEEFLIALNASMEGKYQFTATAKNGAGEEFNQTSNDVQIAYHETMPPPTPSPEPTAEPTIPPPAITEEPTPETNTPFGSQDGEGGGFSWVYIVLGLLAVIVLAVGALLFVDHRRKNPSGTSPKGGGGGSVIDSIQLSTRRDYGRAPKRANAKRGARQEQVERIPGGVATHAPSDADLYEGTASGAAGAYAPSRAETERKPAPANREPAEEAPKRKLVPMDVRADSSFDEETYRRPSAARTEEPPLDELEEIAATSPEEALEEPVAPGRQNEYLSRIRGGASALEGSVPKDAGKAKPPTMSDEEAALLYGGTGQYRLSRNKTPMRPGVGREGQQAGGAATTAGPDAQAEDPEEFTRRQRATRATAKNADLSNFYGDDEPEDGDDTASRSRHRRR